MLSDFWRSKRVQCLAVVVVPAVLFVCIAFYVLTYRSVPRELRPLSGPSLAALEDIYPVMADSSGTLYLDRIRFAKAIEHLRKHPSPRAIADLLYLGNANNIIVRFDGPTRREYLQLRDSTEHGDLSQIDQERDRIFQPYRDIVNAMGQTFAGAPVEIVLHDARNPLRSIIAIQNSITGRRLGDSATNFSLRLIRNYSYGEGGGIGKSAAFINYPLTMKDGRQIKSTTIPLFHEVYGLIGFICIHIDLSRLNEDSARSVTALIESMRATQPNESINELIQSDAR